MTMKLLNSLLLFLKVNVEEDYKMKKIEITPEQRYICSIYGGDEICGSIALSFSIKGKLDKKRFENAIQLIIDNNDVFRYSFSKDEETGKIYQVISDKVVYKLDERFPEGNTYEEKYSNINSRATEIYGDTKIIGTSLWDFILFNMGNDDYIFFGRMNHLISDGVSLSVLFANIVAYYNDFPIKSTKSYEEYIAEQNDIKKSNKYSLQAEKCKDIISDYKMYEQMTDEYKKDDEIINMKWNFLNSYGNDKLNAFCKENKMSMFHVTLFLMHLGISMIYNNNSSIVNVAMGTREKDYANTIGVLASFCWSRVKFSDDISIRDAAVTCRNDYFENSKANMIVSEYMRENKLPVIFVITYQNQISNVKKEIFLGEAKIEFINDPEFLKENGQTNDMIMAISATESDGKTNCSMYSAMDILPEGHINIMQRAFELGIKCLTENDMTFAEFRRAFEK